MAVIKAVTLVPPSLLSNLPGCKLPAEVAQTVTEKHCVRQSCMQAFCRFKFDEAILELVEAMGWIPACVLAACLSSNVAYACSRRREEARAQRHAERGVDPRDPFGEGRHGRGRGRGRQQPQRTSTQIGLSRKDAKQDTAVDDALAGWNVGQNRNSRQGKGPAAIRSLGIDWNVGPAPLPDRSSR